MFGAPASSPFGGGGGFGATPAPAFGGGGGFGSTNNNNNAFGGGGGGFGTNNNAAPFGSPAPAPFGGGGFGAPAPPPAFGGFGTNNNNTGGAFGGGGTNAFGSSTGGGFGSTPFGSPAPAPAGGLFGAPAPAPFGQAPAPTGGGLFGATPAPAGGGLFGSNTNTGGFGGSTFGSTATNTGFGSAPAAPFGAAPAPAFGAPPAGGGMFGSAPSPAGGGIFGGGAAAGPAGGGGTKGTPYQATTRQDGTSSISMQTISAMAQYENKSLEELRYEDYLQGNKGSGNAAGGGGFGAGAFGAPAPATGGLFGGGAPAPAPAFGGSTPFGGAPAPATGFGSSFGKPATGSLFGGGAPTPAPAPFGAFGAPAPAPAFGAPAPAPGLFGAPAPAPFGAPAPAPTAFGFGTTPAPAPFGAPAPPGGLFGAAPAPAFGAAPAPTAFGGFGTTPSPAPFGAPPAPAGGLFGSTPTPAFGAPAPGGSIFGTPAATGGLFGSAPKPPTTPGLFGPPPAGAPQPFGGFGAPAPAPAFGGFGSPPATAPPPTIPPAGSVIPQAASEVLTHQIQALENKRKEMSKLDVWRGNSAEASSVTPASQPQFDGGSSSGVIGTNSQYSSYAPSPRSTAKIRPRGFGPSVTTPTSSSTPLNTIGNGGRSMMSPDAYAASSVKRLVIKPGTPKPKMRLRLTNGPSSNATQAQSATTAESPAATAATASAGATPPVAAQGDQGSSPSPMKSPTPTGTPYTIPVLGGGTPPSTGQSVQGTTASVRANTNAASGGKTVASLEKIAPLIDPAMEYYQKVVGSPDGVPPATPSPQVAAAAQPRSSQKKRAAYVPRLTKPGYVVSPSLEELSLMSEADLASLKGFSIRHDPFGIIAWEGAVDVRNANIDASVDINQSDVSVYTRDEEEGQKPEVGSKLNRPAVITFFNVFPKNGGASADEETKRKFAARIERSTAKFDAELISYDKDSGEWKIRVKHFSRYGLDDEDSDAEESPAQGTPEKIEEAELWEDEELGMDDAAVVSDVDMEKDSGDDDDILIRDAEAAYASIFDTVNSPRGSPPKDEDMGDANEEEEEEEEEVFEDGLTAEKEAACTARNRIRITEEEYNLAASSSGGICSKIASKVFAVNRRGGPSTTSSSIDYGSRLGRSFGVAWSPSGSFLKLGGGGKLERFRPVFNEAGEDGAGTKYLDIHEGKSNKLATSVDDGSPRFSLPVAIGNNGDASSQEELRKTIEAYAADGPDIGRQVFALLNCFVDTEDSMEDNEPMVSLLTTEQKLNMFQTRQKEAVVRFLVKACRPLVDADARLATGRGDAPKAVLAALTGGDISRACKLCFDNGFEELAAAIAAFDVEGSNDFELAANSPPEDETPELLPIYRLLSGDVRAAGELDWLRALLVRMLFGHPQRSGRGLPEVLEEFNQDVASMVAPFPSPSYAHNFKSTAQSIIYRMLRVAEMPQVISIADIIDPHGSSKHNHDFALAFHLACCLSAMGVAGSMSAFEEAHLIDGYCAQLLASGAWEWAVYTCLCTFNPDSSSSDWKRNKAKDIILRNFHSVSERTFLEQEVGVPRAWLAEAISYRHRDNPFDFIANLAAFSPVEASKVVDEIILPNLIFMSVPGQRKSLALLESFQGALSDLSMAMLNLYELSKDLHTLLSAPRDSPSAVEHVPAFTDDLQEIETTLLAHRAECEKMRPGLGIKFHTSAFETIPVTSMLHEALDHCVYLRLQLKAISMGIDMDAATAKKNLTTLLAFHTVEAYDQKLSNANIMRALR